MNEVRRFSTSGGVDVWRLPAETLPQHVNHIYYFCVDDVGVLWDCGSGLGRSRDDVLAGLQAAGAGEEDVDVVLVSHAHIDHFGDAGWWKSRGKEVWVHELDARVLEHFAERQVLSAQELSSWLARAGCDDDERRRLRALYLSSKEQLPSAAVPVDKRLRHKQLLFGGRARVIHTPGHCPGHICLRLDDTLLVADQVLAPVSPIISPQALHPQNGLERYLFGLSRLLDEKDVGLVLSAHYQDIPDLAARITAIVAEHQKKLQKALDAASSSASSSPAGVRIVDVAKAMFGERKGYHALLALLEAGSHVEWLDQHGLLNVANLDEVAADERVAPRYRATTTSAPSL